MQRKRRVVEDAARIQEPDPTETDAEIEDPQPIQADAEIEDPQPLQADAEIEEPEPAEDADEMPEDIRQLPRLTPQMKANMTAAEDASRKVCFLMHM